MRETPILRFRGFCDSWEKKQLSQISLINPRGTELPESFVYIDLESVEKGTLTKTNRIDKVNAPSRAQRLLTKGDIIFQTVRPYQGNNYFFDKDDEDFVASTGYAQIRTKQSSEYLYQYLHTDHFVKKVILRCTGTSYPAINSSDLGLITVSYPALPEQKKIAGFLSAVDHKIRQLQKKKDLLEQYKKGVMQGIFNQEIRFRDDEGKDYPDWKEERLGSLGETVGGGTPDRANLEYWQGEIPWISSSDISEGDIHYIKYDRFISNEAVKSSATKLIPKNSLLFVSRVGIGKLAISDRALTTSQDFTNLILREDSPHYLGYYFLAQKKSLSSLAQGTSIKGFTTVDLKGLKVTIPPLSEQRKIAMFLSSIDDKIKLVIKQLELTRQFKKGLLQQIFV